jgi:hypothetical protein
LGGGLRLPYAIDAAAIRKETGLSQAAFARRIGVPVATIRNREQCLWCHSQHAVSIPPVPPSGPATLW